MNSIIIFGGTFNPVHNGHIAIANYLYDTYKQKITIMPTGVLNYKPKTIISTKDRLAMIELAFGNKDKFIIDRYEVNLKHRCYTYDTLMHVKMHNPNSKITFVLGSDSLYSMNTWDNYQELLQISNFIVFSRNHPASVAPNWENTIRLHTEKSCEVGQIYFEKFNPPNVSSTEIRNNILNKVSIDDFVPTYISKFINEHELYVAKTCG